ncbi:MAG: cytidylate kinase family protein [Deltaproteobacteria bacterium]|nr:cytidylate kinase family protein [Deltaproteobacteria bacterium]
MSIIIISSDSQDIEKTTAGLIAGSLGYGRIERENILPKVAKKYNVSVDELVKVLEKRPSVFRSSVRQWNLLLSYIQEGTVEELREDNLVCYGLAAHLYVLGISHVLRVRILTKEDEKVNQVMSNMGINKQAAGKILDKEKKIRARWSSELFGIDETDSSRYDLSINLNNIDLEEAIKLINETISYRRFAAMTYSIRCMEDLAIVSRARAILIKRFPDVRVQASGGRLIISLLSLKREKEKKTRIIKEMTNNIKGVDYVEVHVFKDYFGHAAESFR